MKELQEIFALYAKASELNVRANKLGQEYTDKNSPFKKGDKILLKENGKELHGIIVRIFFDKHSTLPGMAKLQVEIWNNGFKAPTKKRNLVFISSKNQLVEHFKNLKAA